MNIAKTEFIIIGSRQKMATDELAIKIDYHEIKRVTSVKAIGSHIDQHLSWAVHIDKISKKLRQLLEL